MDSKFEKNLKEIAEKLVKETIQKALIKIGNF